MLDKIIRRISSKNKKSRSISKIISTVMVIALFMQTIILILGFVFFKTDKKLENAQYTNILLNNISKAREIEKLLLKDYDDEEYFERFIENIAIKNKNGKIKNLTEKEIDQFINFSDSIKASGGFMIVGNDLNNLQEANVFSFEDDVPGVNIKGGDDIYVEIGGASILNKKKFRYSPNWSNVVIENSQKDRLFKNIIRKLRDMSVCNEEDKGFFYFNSGNQNSKDRCLYYVRPLKVDESECEFFGILGFRINNETIDSIIKRNDFINSKKMGYLIGKRTEKKDEYEVIYLSGPNLKRYVKGGRFSLLEVKNTFQSNEEGLDNPKKLYILKRDSIENLMGIKKTLRLYYDENRDNIDFFTFFSKDDVNKYSKNISFTLMIILIFSVLFSVLVVAVISKVNQKVILGFLDNIKSIADGGNIYETNIKEFDYLLDKVGDLSKEIIRNSNRFKNILNETDVKIIGFEVYKNGQIFKTGPKDFGYKCSKGEVNLEKGDRIISKEDIEDFKKKLFSNTKLIDEFFDKKNTRKTSIYSKKCDDNMFYFKLIENSNSKDEDIDKIYILIDVTREIKEKIKIKRERDYDLLTGLYNRLSFKEKADNYIEYVKKESLNIYCAVVMWDLDNLKYVNDTYGHSFGDRYIKSAGSVLKEIIKYDEDSSSKDKSQKRKEEYIARMSGDEFFALIIGDTKDEILSRIDEIMIKLNSTYLRIDTQYSVKIRATCGVSFYPDDSLDLEDLIRKADFAMYQAKNKNKGTVNMFKQEDFDKNYILFSGKEDFNNFIEKRLVKYAFQPIVDVKTGEIFAFEALMRSTSDKIQNVFDVMRIAKSQSRLRDIEIITFEEVLKFYNENISRFKGRKLFVNSIASTVLPKENLNNIIENYRNSFENMVIEIVEADTMDKNAFEIKDKFRNTFGSNIAIDDFGEGYSNEGRLLYVRPEYVKIDMGLIRDIDKDKDKEEIVRVLIGYAKKANILVISEGVETFAEAEKCICLGTDFIQGYLFGKPSFEVMEEIEDSKLKYLKEINEKIKKRKEFGTK